MEVAGFERQLIHIHGSVSGGKIDAINKVNRGINTMLFP